jgi:hypothetical protein
VTDVLVRGVPDDVLAAIDEQAARQGLSRSEFLVRVLALAAAGGTEPVTVESLRRFSDTCADLGDPDVMAQAWRGSSPPSPDSRSRG